MVVKKLKTKSKIHCFIGLTPLSVKCDFKMIITFFTIKMDVVLPIAIYSRFVLPPWAPKPDIF